MQQTDQVNKIMANSVGAEVLHYPTVTKSVAKQRLHCEGQQLGV